VTLAPFLFLIVAKVLTGLVREAKRASLFNDVEIGTHRKYRLIYYSLLMVLYSSVNLHIIMCWWLKKY